MDVPTDGVTHLAPAKNVNFALVGVTSAQAGIRTREKEAVRETFFFFQAEDGIRDRDVTGVQTCALPISETYLKRSSFHPGQEYAISFVLRATIRLFHYFFGQGAVGVVALLLFVIVVAILIRDRCPAGTFPTSRQLAFLMTFPLIVNCALGLKDIYPYG